MKHSKKPKGAKAVTLSSGVFWDTGASGPANQAQLVDEDISEFDPKTEKPTPNPNNIKRRRRINVVDDLVAKGILDAEHQRAAFAMWTAADEYTEGDPLKGFKVDGGTGPLPPNGNWMLMQMQRAVPPYARKIVDRVVLENMTIQKAAGRKYSSFLDGCAKLRLGLKAVSERLDAG